jgi:hypothetical protein
MTYKVIAAILMAVVLLLTGAALGSANSQVLIPKAEDVRFVLLSNEPIALPDRHSIVAGWSSMLFKDLRTGQCFVAFTGGSASAVAAVPCN